MERVVASYEAWDHARVDRDRAIENDLQPHVRGRVHGPSAQDLDVGVPPSDQNNIANGAQWIVSLGVIGPPLRLVWMRLGLAGR